MYKLKNFPKIHMIGIGGIGMSALAFVLAKKGYEISGSDIAESLITEKLKKCGICVTIRHLASSIKDQDIVVYSSSIRENNPELIAAKKRKIKIISRIELLKSVMEMNKRVVAVTGTHGKTTITAMTSLLLEKAGFDPTVLIGGQSLYFKGNAKLGRKSNLVAEVDESDGRFVMLRSTHIIMPNLEKEHLEHYKDEKDLLETFKKFLSAQSRKSVFFYRIDDANLRKLSKYFKGKTHSFGFTKEADLTADRIMIEPFKISFDCFYKKKMLERFTMNIPGVHNIINALATICLGIELGIDTKIIKDALFNYKGVKRRFEVIGSVRGVKIVEDYAHHPTEIRAVIQAAYSLDPKRLITVFQPHRYTRTKSFYKEFSTSFAGSTEVILTDVYSASEPKIKGAGTRGIYDIMSTDDTLPVKLMDKKKIPQYLSKKAKKGDLILVLGAGDIGKSAHEVLARLKKT